MKTDIYYPTEMLVDGGPPFEVNCPPVPLAHINEDLPIKLSCTLKQHPSGAPFVQFYVHAHDRVLMETDVPEDVAQYFKDYTQRVKDWATKI